MKKRPLADYSALQREILHVVAANPGLNGAEIHRAVEEVRDKQHRHETVSRYLQQFADVFLVEKNGDRQEQSYCLTNVGRDLLRADLNWQLDR